MITADEIREMRGWAAEARRCGDGNCVRRVVRMDPDDLDRLLDALEGTRSTTRGGGGVVVFDLAAFRRSKDDPTPPDAA